APNAAPRSKKTPSRPMAARKMLGLEQSLGSRIVTDADDLVILCRNGNPEQASLHLRKLIGQLKLPRCTSIRLAAVRRRVSGFKPAGGRRLTRRRRPVGWQPKVGIGAGGWN